MVTPFNGLGSGSSAECSDASTIRGSPESPMNGTAALLNISRIRGVPARIGGDCAGTEKERAPGPPNDRAPPEARTIGNFSEQIQDRIDDQHPQGVNEGPVAHRGQNAPRPL